jgi:mono/diheme cytochrome c family protein
MKTKLTLMGALIGIAALAAGCGSSSSQPEQPVADVPQVYTQNCATCHGKGLEGGGSMPKLSNVGARMSEEQIKNRILKGGGAMPAFEKRLNPEQVTQLASYLAARK